MQNQVGRVINKRYRVDESIGRGGMAEVYKVWDEERAVFLAMKVMNADLAEDRSFIRRFKREADTLTFLQHPHIVRSYGLEQSGRTAFLLMDYIEGSTLRSEIFDSNGPLPYSRVLEIMQPVCNALHFAHLKGMVHCDVKPANIMIHKNGTILLTDFGIARQAEGATTTTMATAGAPAYMAPEQVRGDEASPQMDIYALGVVLYEMLTGGERPFTGEMATITGTTGEKVRWEQVNLRPLSPRRYNPNISEELEAVVLKCLEKNPKKRFGSVQELLMALQSAFGLAELKDPLPEPPPPVNENKTPKNNQQTEPKNETTGEALVRHRLSRLRWIGLGLAGVAILILGLFIGRSNPADFLFFQVATVIPQPTTTPQPSPTPEPTITPQPSPTLEPAPGATRTRETDGMVMVYVPAGPFIMGSNTGADDEKPEHTATTGGYWIDRTEVTNGEYRQCVRTGPCQPPGVSGSNTRAEYYGNSQYDNHPVINVNWEQARTYCAWAGGRLPSEKEWEKAARGEDGRTYPWGNESPNSSLANYGGKDTTAVGQYEEGKSPYGAYDMAGNVWEWVDDWYDKYPGGGEYSDFGEKYKVLRGGSWDDSVYIIRSAFRGWFVPSFMVNVIGFRCLVSN